MRSAIKKVWNSVLLLTVFAMMLIGTSVVASAAEEGTMMSNAVNITFGRSYVKTWTTYRDHLNHYCKITLPDRGIITINATKPYDSEGEYGSIYFTLYDDEANPIWGSESYYSKKMASASYKNCVGLEAGTYYLTLLPGFTVTSGTISTTYSISYTSTPYCETEPNASIAQATMMQLGQTYTGYYGKDGSDYERNDYWRVSLAAGKSYKIAVGNFAAILDNTTLIYLYAPDGTKKSLKGSMENLVDEEGMNYLLYTAAQGGMYSICFDNYSKQQYKYTLLVAEQEKRDPGIRIPAATITKLNTDSSFSLNVTAATDSRLTYAVSDSNIASVLSSGTVYLRRKAGTAVITITSNETDLYKAGSATITLIVVDPNASGSTGGTNTSRQTRYTKRAQMMFAAAKKPSVKASKLKKKKQTIPAVKAFVVNNAVGQITFRKLGGSKKLSISENGNIIVKKKTKKGTYKMTVLVTASGNAAYKSTDKTVVVKVKVK